MVLWEKLKWFEKNVFKPIFVDISRPEIAILVKQILKSAIFLSSQCDLKEK